ncbi:MAG TPA: ImmA/IrrE family metallo-endopeptidase [Candidatus Didemnitutus sp.]|nr:ImmA/IrrE family metallo-endopeptidase [Candidatus Didemnitutus sp.]
MKTTSNQFHQPIAFHPGETLREKLFELDMTLKEFALRAGKPEKTVIAVLNGDSSITHEMAVQFEHVLKIPAHVWTSIQCDYDEYLAREERKEQLKASARWGKKFPVAEMVKKGWLPVAATAHEKTEALCAFFGMSGHSAWEDYYLNQELKVAFRISLSHAKEPHAISAWLRRGELQAVELPTHPYDESGFKRALERIRCLMVQHPADVLQQLQKICLEVGVKVVYTPCIKKAPLNGCSRWLKDNPLIQLSGRYKRNDVFWFTFFHEAGHILLHGKKDIFLEDYDYSEVDRKKEDEADRFAVRWTLTIEGDQELKHRGSMTEREIVALAKRINTHPAIIVGRLQHDRKVRPTFGHRLLETIEFK